MEANAGKSFQMQILFNIFPRISLHCKLVPVQYWEYEYGLLMTHFTMKYVLKESVAWIEVEILKTILLSGYPLVKMAGCWYFILE